MIIKNNINIAESEQTGYCTEIVMKIYNQKYLF